LKTSIDIADVLALITVAGVAVYVAGLVGLAIAIRREFTRDISTAWYVVALIPRTVVAGQGVRIWLLWPVTLGALLTVLVALIAGRPDLAPLIPVTGLVFASVLSLLVLRTIQRPQPQRGMDSTWLAGHLIVFAAIASLVGSIMMAKGVHLVFLTAVDAANLVSASLGRSFLVGAILFIVGGFLVALPGAAVVSDPLPPVRIYRGAGGACLDGYLVTHADGFWYLMIEDDDKQKELQTIPDTEVSEVRTIEKVDIGCTEASALPEAGPEDDAKPGAEKAK
jgi:hypothetical protein